MKIIVKHDGDFVNITLIEGNTCINLGLFGAGERDSLAKVLIDAVYEMGPRYLSDCDRWFKKMLTECNIELSDR